MANDPAAVLPLQRRYAAVVAADENGVIGRDGQLPWRLSADLKRFRRITMGHHLVMGRKTLESIGRLLPGRTTVVLSRNADWRFPGALVARSVAEVDQITAGDQQPMVVGGGEIYRLFWPRISELFFTRVHCRIGGDTSLPPLDWSRWQLVEEIAEPAGEENEFASTFQRWKLA